MKYQYKEDAFISSLSAKLRIDNLFNPSVFNIFIATSIIVSLFSGVRSDINTHPFLQNKYIKKNNINKIIDATHPYAIEVSKNAIQCAKELNIDYLRYERKSLIEDISYENKYIVSSIEEACKIAREKGRNIFIGTGSKNLPKIVELIPDRNLIVRVLPTSDVILSCESLGLNADNIIAMKGPFSQSINEEFYKHYNVDIVVTKESGIAGGFLEKVNACETLQIPVVIITRERINYPLVVNEIDELEKLL